MFAGRIAVGAVAALLAAVVIAAGLVVAGVQVALAVNWEIPDPVAATQPSEVYDRNGEPLARFAADVEREPVELDEIADSMIDAVVVKEDRNFWEHRGVDTLSVVRAVWRNMQTGTIAEGGSTLTQQYVKNAFIGADQTYTRKAREAMIALQLEKERSKEGILTDYLNEVYFGDGAYGVEAAAQSYFDKSADELALHESATIASVLSAPSRHSPRNDPRGALARRNQLLDAMAAHGAVSQREAQQAKDRPIDLAPRDERVFAAPHFVEAVRAELLDAYGYETVYYGGLEVTTTLDLQQQERLAEQIEQHLPSDERVDAGAVALDHATGEIIATYPGRVAFDDSEVDLALRFGRPTGSAFKPVVMATALEEGRDLSSAVAAPSSVTIGNWSVGGSRCPGGSCTLHQAMVVSSNTAFANLANEVGAARFIDMAHRLGMRAEFADHDLSQALGTASLSPLDMASAFATFANRGVQCPAHTVREVTDADGNAVDLPQPRHPSEEQLEEWAAHLEDRGYRFLEGVDGLGRCHRAIAPSVAYDVTEALQDVVSDGTGTNAQIDRRQAGKTGTTDDSRELWFTGYTPRLTLSVFVANRDDNDPLRNLPGCTGSCFGGDTPALMWADAAEALLEGTTPRSFPDERPTTDRPPEHREHTFDHEPDEPETPSPSPVPSPQDGEGPGEPDASEDDAGADPQPGDDPEPPQPGDPPAPGSQPEYGDDSLRERDDPPSGPDDQPDSDDGGGMLPLP